MQRPFNIRLWFALAGFGIIGLIWIGSAWWLSDFLTHSLLERESEVSQEFLQGIADSEGASLFEAEPLARPQSPDLLKFVQQIVSMPGIMRVNVYSAKSVVLWSSEEQLIGKSFADNEDLDTALKGERITEINSLEHHKDEYLAFGAKGLFIEGYLPMRSNDSERRVVGVVEVYKFPTELNKTIAQGKTIIWLTGLAAAILAYTTLYWIVQRGARIIESQQVQMRDMQSAALVGELAGAVAHSLRNPMAAIRSSAELWRGAIPRDAASVADDIINEVDRMNDYVRDLLNYARSDKSQLRRVDPMSIVDIVLGKREAALRRNNVTVAASDRRGAASQVLVDPILFEHALTSVVNNAIEAMPTRGALEVNVSHDAAGKHVVTEISDNGSGIPAAVIGQVTESYFTTKSQGLGLGLALAKGVVERWGGAVSIVSSPEVGTTVSIILGKA